MSLSCKAQLPGSSALVISKLLEGEFIRIHKIELEPVLWTLKAKVLLVESDKELGLTEPLQEAAAITDSACTKINMSTNNIKCLILIFLSVEVFYLLIKLFIKMQKKWLNTDV